MQDDERRRDARARIALPIHVVRRGVVETVEMLDASYRGLFIKIDEPPPERQLIKLLIELPSRDLEVHAVVVRVVVDALGQSGIGLRFFALNGQDRADWEAYISSLLHKRARAA